MTPGNNICMFCGSQWRKSAATPERLHADLFLTSEKLTPPCLWHQLAFLWPLFAFCPLKQHADPLACTPTVRNIHDNVQIIACAWYTVYTDSYVWWAPTLVPPTLMMR